MEQAKPIVSGMEQRGQSSWWWKIGRAKPASQALISLIRLYQVAISPLLGNRCRFYPSCSEYALACFRGLGFFRACSLSAIRLLRCHPLSKGYFDPAPIDQADLSARKR